MQDGSVVTWGSPLYGGDSSTVRAELNKWINKRDKYVQFFVEFFDTRNLAILAGKYYPKIQIYSLAGTFTAVLPNRTLLQWGELG
jgi:hypothetical protein